MAGFAVWISVDFLRNNSLNMLGKGFIHTADGRRKRLVSADNNFLTSLVLLHRQEVFSPDLVHIPTFFVGIAKVSSKGELDNGGIIVNDGH